MLGARDMIFASVGSMLPFDRLTRAVDEWAKDNPDIPVFLQIGEGEYEPRHCEWARIVPHREYQAKLDSCALFVAHVGMGSILQALEIGKPILMMPRQAALREHTTDHQLHTADRFRDAAGVHIVDDEVALRREMSKLVRDPGESGKEISPWASRELIDNLRDWILAKP